MVGFFSRLKGKDGSSNKKKGHLQAIEQPAKPQWVDAWTRTSIEPEEVQELLHGCTIELKSKGMMRFQSSSYLPTFSIAFS
jgi:hypothetical protein